MYFQDKLLTVINIHTSLHMALNKETACSKHCSQILANGALWALFSSLETGGEDTNRTSQGYCED